MKVNEKSLDRERVERAFPHETKAVEKLLEAFDAMHVAQQIVAFEITTDALQELAQGLDEPDSARDRITLEIAADWLAGIQYAAK
jgi:hypothetical protein